MSAALVLFIMRGFAYGLTLELHEEGVPETYAYASKNPFSSFLSASVSLGALFGRTVGK